MVKQFAIIRRNLDKSNSDLVLFSMGLVISIIIASGLGIALIFVSTSMPDITSPVAWVDSYNTRSFLSILSIGAWGAVIFFLFMTIDTAMKRTHLIDRSIFNIEGWD